MSQIYHPLRPLEDRIIVCEGDDDHAFISGVLSSFQSILVYHANGSNNVSSLASILSPSIYIKDRDFSYTSQQAKKTFSTNTPKTVWQRVMLENYLLYANWFQEFLTRAENSPVKVAHSPNDAEEIEQDILQFAASLIFDHAGQRTIELMIKALPPQYGYKPKINKEYVSTGASASGYDSWKTLFDSEAQRISNLGASISNRNIVNELLKTFDEQVSFYEKASQNIDSVRLEFEGKRILQFLAPKWGITGGKDKPWKVCQKSLIQSAIRYSKSISNIRQDDRLGDFGLLAEKALK